MSKHVSLINIKNVRVLTRLVYIFIMQQTCHTTRHYKKVPPAKIALEALQIVFYITRDLSEKRRAVQLHRKVASLYDTQDLITACARAYS